jgi:hypothetical protein
LLAQAVARGLQPRFVEGDLDDLEVLGHFAGASPGPSAAAQLTV